MKKYLFVLKLFVSVFFTIIIFILSIYVYAFITPKVDVKQNDSIILLDKDGNNIFDKDYKNYVK